MKAAFPIVTSHFVDERGMTLRDYFAAQILAAMVGAAREDGLELRHPKAEAQTAYEFADAMIEERER